MPIRTREFYLTRGSRTSIHLFEGRWNDHFSFSDALLWNQYKFVVFNIFSYCILIIPCQIFNLTIISNEKPYTAYRKSGAHDIYRWDPETREPEPQKVYGARVPGPKIFKWDPGPRTPKVGARTQGSKSETWDLHSTLAFSCILHLIHSLHLLRNFALICL